MKTKNLNISEKLHKQLKAHCIKTNQKINGFAEKAIVGQIAIESKSKQFAA